MNCLFCKIINKEIPADVIHEDENLLAFNDIRPQAPTHILIIPKKHIETINDLAETDEIVSGKMLLLAKKLASAHGFAESGYRLVFNVNAAGGQEVYHIHLHVLGGRQMHWPPG